MDIANTLAAWWGAVVATLVAVYNIYTRFADLRVDLDVRVYHKPERAPGIQTWDVTIVEISNKGKVATTIRKVLIEDMGSSPVERWAKVDCEGKPLPFDLKTGEHWTGIADNDLTERIVTKINDGVFVSIHHAHSKTPFRVKLKSIFRLRDQ